MLHPDYQYSPRLITAMSSMIVSGHYDLVLGSRILGGMALKGGMPLYKYMANRALTFIENLALGVKLSEYHTGYRAFSRTVLETLPLEANSDDFVFDTRYFQEASSISFRRSVKYGMGVLDTSAKYLMHKYGLIHSPLFRQKKTG